MAIAEAVSPNGSPVVAINLLAPDLRGVELNVRGTAPLICHRWSEKAKKQMLDKQTKKATVGKEAKNPQEDFEQSLYPLGNGVYGFPAVAFKAAAVRAGTYSDMKMTFLRGAFHVNGPNGNELVTINGEPRSREDMVRVGMGTADIRYRGEFPTWTTVLFVRYNATAISLDQLVNLFQIAGFSVGVGEWRPERDGSFGLFEVV